MALTKKQKLADSCYIAAGMRGGQKDKELNTTERRMMKELAEDKLVKLGRDGCWHVQAI